MWTYFVIFFSLALLLVVFIYRVVAYYRKSCGESSKADARDADTGADVDVESDVDVKIKLSREEKGQVEALCKRGEALINAGKDEEAIKCFVQALTLDSSHLGTQQRLALLYLQKQMYSAAAALFQQLAQQTNDPMHYSHLGLSFYQQSDFENAKIAYQTAVDLDPSRPQRFVSLSQVYRSLGQLANAIIAVNKAVEIDQANVEFLYLLADLQIEAGNLIVAKETLNKLLGVDAENKEAKALLKEIKKLEKEAGGAAL